MVDDTKTAGPLSPEQPASGVPRGVVMAAVSLALGLGVLVGSRLARRPELAVPTVVPPCADCAEREARLADIVARLELVAAGNPWAAQRPPQGGENGTQAGPAVAAGLPITGGGV